MRQETGSKTQPTQRVISIRITSDGDNFSRQSPTEESARVVVVLETPKAMLVPAPMLSQLPPEEHLLSAGIAVELPLEEILTLPSEDDTEIIALVALRTELLSSIRAIYGQDVKITTPLLAPSPARGSTLLIHLSPESTLMTLKLYNNTELLFAEIFECRGSADVLYWVERLGQGYDLKGYTIYIDGVWCEDVEQLLRRYYKSVKQCES